MITKFMGSQGFKWFIGSVEDISDPLMLGRVRVRCYGIHSDDINEVKTEHLPWATVVQPITSAGNKGRGISPTGAVVGTQVIGFFMDGSTGQYPIVLGSIGGINNRGPEGTLPDQLLNQRLNTPAQGQNSNERPAPNTTGAGSTTPAAASTPSGTPAPTSSLTTIAPGQIGSLTPEQFNQLKNTIGQKESGGSYSKENSIGFIGKYQFGADALYEQGYVNTTPSKSGKRVAQITGDPACWRGKNGINSKQDWFNSPQEQEKAMDIFTMNNYKTLLRLGTLTAASRPREIAGFLMVAHLLGAGGANKYKTTGSGADAYGTTGGQYYKYGHNSITDNSPTV